MVGFRCISDSSNHQTNNQTIKQSNNYNSQQPNDMIKNYFKIAFRNLSKKKNYSLLNTAGLGIGMACCFLMLLYIIDEKSYDKWMPGHEQVARVAIDIKTQNETHIVFAPNSAPLAAALKEYPQIEEATRFIKFQNDDRL